MIFEMLDRVLFDWGLPFLLFGVGLVYLFALRAFPYLHPLKTLRQAFKGRKRSSLRALSVALGGTLGVGNITGVALALSLGGAGAVFWMWVSPVGAARTGRGKGARCIICGARGAFLDGALRGALPFCVFFAP